MSAEDAKICFLRHATSKISTDEDLDAIYTLGFRGEALSSIGAVAKVKLYTKKQDTDIGVLVTCEGGEILSSNQSGMSDGTVLEVSDLFYNTPARKKFLKKPATEAGYISDIIGRYVFSHPEISFKLIRDEKEIIFSSGDNNIINAVYSVYGKDYAKNMLDVDYEYNGIRVTGLIGKGTLCRANRNYETFFVNKRYIKSGLMIRALEEAYKNQIMISKFPTAVLNIEIPVELVDINVHPTKLECKFSNEQDIYQAVYHAVKSTLYALPNVPEINHTPQDRTVKITESVQQKSIEDIFREKLRESQTRKSDIERITHNEPAGDKFVIQNSADESVEEVKTEPVIENVPAYSEFAMLDYAMEHSRHIQERMKVKSPGEETPETEKIEQEDWQEYLIRRIEGSKTSQIEGNPFGNGYFRIIGQLFDTYILVEKENNLLIIDQHAAHERLNYEKLKDQIEKSGIVSQLVFEPIAIKLHPNELVVFENNKETFVKLGFDCALAVDTVIIKGLPGDIGWSDGETLFMELLSQMDELKNDIISKNKERLLYTISCKASIRANMRVNGMEMQRLVENVFKLKNINTCPHGRPIVISMSKKQIEKDFKRIV